ncbi:MAG: hypothetical protein A2Z14_16815 [Chloroflexi bacterium RBG_16_48_8]|nr:MAG: hypothetical protein A2Z14_16815 [Chloroflexi bacterium RBG_16_48_8]
MNTYQEIQTASEQAGIWQAVRVGALHYLETGVLPWLESRTEIEGNAFRWPLSKVEETTLASRWKPHFPMFEELIDIAIAEERLDDVVHWYRQRNLGREWWNRASSSDDKIAEAVVEAHPDVAIEIWKGIAEFQITKTQTEAYEVAARYLRKIYRVLQRLRHEEEWCSYLAEIRTANHRKIRLIEILDSLIGRSIVDG